MTTMNPLATLKEIGAIEWRINDAALDPRIKVACIKRNLDNLIDTTAPARKFHGIILRCRAALDASDTLELSAGISLLRSIVPTTYGMIPAGTVFRAPQGGVYIKRKGGIEEIHTSALFKHLDADAPVQVINE